MPPAVLIEPVVVLVASVDEVTFITVFALIVAAFIVVMLAVDIIAVVVPRLPTLAFPVTVSTPPVTKFAPVTFPVPVM